MSNNSNKNDKAPVLEPAVSITDMVVDIGAGRSLTIGDSVFVDGICRLKSEDQAEALESWLVSTGTAHEVVQYDARDRRHNPRPIATNAVTDMLGVDSMAARIGAIIDSTAVKVEAPE